MSVDNQWLQQQFPNLYDIQALSGGGQKLVFSCFDPEYKECVLKLVRPGAEDRFDREMEAVTRVTSEFIPHIFRVGLVKSQVGDLIWLLEQRVSGETLRQVLMKGPLLKNQLLTLVANLLSAISTAESARVVHRDIKPENIMIDHSGKAWLLDFGIARILDLDSKTRTDAVSGPHTPGYGAPEQFRNRKRDIDSRTDLFATGVVLFESVTGKNPFIHGARDRIEILNRVERMPLPKLKLDWDLSGHFAEFISCMVQKFPYQRPKSCAEASEWIKEIMKEQEGL